MDLYLKKESGYFPKVRDDILPLLPERAEWVLEIGCAEGATMLFVREKLKSTWIGGVDILEKSVEKARNRLDWVSQSNIETMELPFDENSMDLILCLDVFEHLVDPWTVCRRLSKLLKPGGVLIVCIPNILHHSVLLQLLLQKRFDYCVDGVLDNTHLRFFTKLTAVELVEVGGLIVDKVYSNGLEVCSKAWFLNMLSLGVFKVVFEFQYLMRAVKI
jgi:2-polyprenyl-3-methyl-5-hydroxy-6-metoxy-1,4-benzoquinol methylase